MDTSTLQGVLYLLLIFKSLKGKWLADAGFDVDSNVDIFIENGKLIILKME